MKNFSCGSQLEPSKFRHHLAPGSLYQNVPRGTLRPIGIDYTLPNCSSRRSTSTASITHTHYGLWQERHQLRSPISCVGLDKKSVPSKGRACSIALVVASFIVLVVVLTIAGLALYMGISDTEAATSAIITFSCSAKILSGDRFIGALEEKAQRYRRQIEVLYEKSALGPALFSSAVDRFGKDGLTIYFRVAFNRHRLISDLTNIEKAIRDIFLSDAYSKKRIFKNVRFDPKSITVRQLQKDTDTYSASQTISPKNTVKSNKMGIVLKSFKNSTIQVTTAKTLIKDEPEFDEDALPVIQGSFKISKTEADITEKKTETYETKVKQDKTISVPARDVTVRESSVTSASYKIPSGKSKITKIVSGTATSLISTKQSSTIPPLLAKTNRPVSVTATTIYVGISTDSNLTVGISTETSLSSTTKHNGSPQLVDNEPWIPILPNISGYPSEEISENVPTYTSFTNPGLSFHFQDAGRLESTSLKSHPIPVNKIPFTYPYSDYATTEPTKNLIVMTEMTTSTFKADVGEETSFVKMDTIQYESETESDENMNTDYPIKNISAIFYNLATSLEKTNFSSIESAYVPEVIPEVKEQTGVQGQVEVVEVDVEELLMPTTIVPLVTLLPVRSNSGIARPFYRNRFGDTNNLSVENRSFPSHATRHNLNSFDKHRNKSKVVPNPTNISSMDNYQIMGILNFAKERSDESSAGQQDIIRSPKMDRENKEEALLHPVGFSFSATGSSTTSLKGPNRLSPEQIKKLSEISNINDNDTYFKDQPLISTKAISSSYSISQNGLKILTKSFNKMPNDLTKNVTNNYRKNGLAHEDGDCEMLNFKCGDGKCLPESTKCNQLIDCMDGSDEENCNCADYLKSQLLINKICDGVVDCWDFSDENRCDWCNPNQYVCSNSKVCIDKENICDGLRDCPQGDDERQCVTIASDAITANDFPYYSQGYLMVRKHGNWGKLCVDNFENVVSESQISWEIADLGKAICKSMTYQKMKNIENIEETKLAEEQQYFELAYTTENSSKSNLSFKDSNCPTKKVVKVTCQQLECGARPQAVKHIARRVYRVVGGGNAGLGAWPWQVALYKEGEFQCGATLLSDRWLVSAGHCFYRSPNDHWVARLGALRRGTTLPSPYEQLRTILRIIVHPSYLDFGFINDISLLQMEHPVIFSDYVRPVCLPQPNEILENGQLCTVIGWGQLFEVGRIFPDTLQEVQIPVISTAECRKRTLFLPLYKITDDMFCAGYDRGGRDACLGDSGGPLMCSEPNGRWTLHGITSNGYGCARANRPGVYTKVANYVQWINSYIYGDESHSVNVTKITTSCSGHRCPLGECLPESRLCNGYIECSDASDEKNCKKS